MNYSIKVTDSQGNLVYLDDCAGTFGEPFEYAMASLVDMQLGCSFGRVVSTGLKMELQKAECGTVSTVVTVYGI